MITRILHLAVYAFQAVRRAGWFVIRPQAVGVHGIPLTPSGQIVLVKLSYAAGWRLPGGGKKPEEDEVAALIRELREEIGMVDHESLEPVCGFQHRPDYRQGIATLFVVRGVRYHARWSLEVKEVREFDPLALPPDTARVTHELLGLAADHLETGQVQLGREPGRFQPPGRSAPWSTTSRAAGSDPA